jgi:hypothetical protein|tara:strand:+ start:178 stop:297 length:120 start_codon:yes stop_codon:yes gene_type:complete
VLNLFDDVMYSLEINGTVEIPTRGRTNLIRIDFVVAIPT